MNTEVSNSEGKKVSNRLAVALTFLFNPPPLGPVPSQPNRLAHRLCSGVNAISSAVMKRADAYFQAGCPVDLCEQAAARDLWLEINHL